MLGNSYEAERLKRYCVEETCREYYRYDFYPFVMTRKVWTFIYSDGSVETLTMRSN